MPGGQVVEFDCPETSTILGEAEDQGYELPYSCLTGQCSVCTGRVLDGGEVDQSQQTFLTEEQVGDDYVLTCVCYPRSDVRLQTHCDSDVAAFKVTDEERASAGDLWGDDDDFGFGGSGDGGGDAAMF